jgi:lysyl-tRNA synthetase class 2
MKLTEKMFEYVIRSVFGRVKIEYEGKAIDFKTPWPRVEFSQLLKKETKIDLEEINLEALKKEAKKLGVEVKKGAGKVEVADEIYKKYCRPKIWQPTFIIHYPAGFQPLAKTLEDDKTKLANFQLVVAGWELINAFSELNDPIEQKERFKEQEKFFKQGMPPAAGFGMGIDRLTALLTDSHSLREVILFPLMRKK